MSAHPQQFERTESLHSDTRMKKIPFTIELNRKQYTGYLQTTDTTSPPKTFFVIIENFIIGDLSCRDTWIFEQRGRYSFIGKLKPGECYYLAEYLGNLAVLAYE
jgi:hypothetical protein